MKNKIILDLEILLKVESIINWSIETSFQNLWFNFINIPFAFLYILEITESIAKNYCLHPDFPR